MHQYVAYGLAIRSDLFLPELTVASESHTGWADVVVRVAAVQPLPVEVDAAGFGFWATKDEACHFVEKVGAFLVRGGREIVVDPAPGVEDRVLRLSLLGPALALILHQRGFLVLHASVVARADHAVAFLGSNGWGKSTIAASLHARGHDLVADDVAAIALHPEGPTVLPGFPQIKLWPEAVGLLGHATEELPVLHPAFEKRGWRAERGFSMTPRRLRRLYVLAVGSHPGVEPLEPREACLELMGHWYGHRFGHGLLRAERAAAHLRQCGALVAAVPMHRLYRAPGGPSALLDLAALVEGGLHETPPTVVRTGSVAG
jgi:hypothetical protein